MKQLYKYRPSPAMIVALIALFVALGGSATAGILVTGKQIRNGSVTGIDVKNNSLTSKDIRDIRSKDIKDGSLRARDFRTGELGSQGPQGERGPRGNPGVSFGDGRLVPNANDIACDTDVVVGSQQVAITETRRIWVHGHGSFRPDGAAATEYAIWLRLQDGTNTTVAVSTAAWDANVTIGDADTVMVLATGGVLLTGATPEGADAAYEAPPGTYTLQLIARASGGPPCVVDLPDFGYNQGNGMSYALIGTG